MSFDHILERVENVSNATNQLRSIQVALSTLRLASAINPRDLFGHNVGSHRKLAEVAHDAITSFGPLNALGWDFDHTVKAELLTVYYNLCVVRGLSRMLGGDRDALSKEEPHVEFRVKKLLEEYAKKCCEQWTPEELEAFQKEPREFSPVFQAWLDEGLKD